MANAGRGSKVYAISKVRLDDDGRVTHVYWGEVDIGKNDWAAAEQVSPVIQAVHAIRAGHEVFALFPSEHGHLPERRFRVVAYDNGFETISMDGAPTFEREVHDMERLEV